MNKLSIYLTFTLTVCCLVSHGTEIWTESFDSPVTFDKNEGDESRTYYTFGKEFGIQNRSPSWSKWNGVEFDGNFTSAATNPNLSGQGNVSNNSVWSIQDETVVANVTYTFTGYFGWTENDNDSSLSDPEYLANDISFDGNKTGFLLYDPSNPDPEDREEIVQATKVDFTFGENEEDTFHLVTFSYTTSSADVGKEIGFNLRINDSGNVDGSIYLFADEFVITKTSLVPELSAYSLIVGCLVLSSVMLRRRREISYF